MIKYCVGELNYRVTILILCINRVGTMFRPTLFLVCHVLYRTTNLFDSYTMRYAIQVLPDQRILSSFVIFLILLQTSNESYPVVVFAASAKCNFIGLNQTTLSKPRSRLKGSVLIFKVFFQATTKINIF